VPQQHTVSPLFTEKVALTLPTTGGRSVGIVRSWTQTKEFVLLENNGSKVSRVVATQGEVRFGSLLNAAQEK
jgi:hypothetical protein